MQWLPRERRDPLFVPRQGLALLLPFGGVPQAYFALFVCRREALSYTSNQERGSRNLELQTILDIRQKYQYSAA